MKRLLSLMLVTLVGLVGVLLAAAPARADDNPSSWRISRYAVTADVDAQGTTSVVIDLDFDFGFDSGHGPFITLPLQQRVEGNPDVWRMVDVDLGAVSSRTGAPTAIDTTVENGVLVVRIGDPDIEVRGVQQYTINYTARGLIAPQQAQSDLDEFNWNAVGTGWQVPLLDVSVVVNGPVPVERTACFWGSGFNLPCESSVSGNSASYAVDRLDPSEGLQVVAGFPAGTFTGAEPRFTKRLHPGNMFPVTPLTGGLTGAATALGLGLVIARTRRSARDEVYLGLTPGVTPAPGQQTAVGRAGRDTPVAVQFTPPKGATPGEVGTLLDAKADHEDVTATILDLAVRGHFRIVEEDKKHWRFLRLRSDDRLTNPERHVIDTLFSEGPQVTTADLRDKSYHHLLPGTRSRLYERVTDELRWFKTRPTWARGLAIVAGAALVLGGVVLGLALALVGFGLLGLAPIVVGVALMLLNNQFGRRTAEGSAVLAQAKGFELYLRTAEADQIKFEESIDVFSRYLPYAIVFGVAERWTKIFADLAAQGRYQADTSWYVGPYPYFYGSSFSHAMDDLSHSLSQSMQAAVAAQTQATAGSSGGSGFSGGGGFGGGGGGGW